ncbi:MAG: DKNYY domain-containing protein, partial [Chitinophagaceae bacterium]|nr:DKNYY domain-containing protein [Chitinophagaceae bacterium]
MGCGYGRDDKNVFYQRDLIPGADVATFKTIKDNYAADAFSEYFMATVLSRVESSLEIKNPTLYENLQGRIVLKVEQKGEAYYLSPVERKMYFLARPENAFVVMREQGVG